MGRMLEIRIDRRQVSKPILKRAVEALVGGAVVVFPTDTAYGLAADPDNAKAVRRVFAIKGRKIEKQLPLIAGSPAMAAALVRLSGLSLKLAKKYWPGPITIIVQVRPNKLKMIGGRAKTVAIRVPASAWARAIAQGLGRPITSTSANISGQPTIYVPAAIRRSFSGRRRQPDLFLNAGRLPTKPPSTIVKVRGSRIVTLRPGPIEPKIR